MQLLAGWGQEGGLQGPASDHTLGMGGDPAKGMDHGAKRPNTDSKVQEVNPTEPLLSCLECGQREAGSDGDGRNDSICRNSETVLASTLIGRM